MTHTVKAVAALAGISVRTLHHYDEIGLLKPAEVSASGYRLYSRADLERLQQVLFYKELGFSLAEIGEILDNPGFDQRAALVEHRRLLLEQQARLGRLLRSVDETLAALEGVTTMTDKELFAGFDNSQYEEEVKERWGHTEAYRQSTERAKRYTKADWAEIQAEQQALFEGLAGLMERDPGDAEVQALIGRWHQLINDRFYSCPIDVFRGVGEMYVDDPRFTATYDKIKPGLAVFKRDAMRIYCDRA